VIPSFCAFACSSPDYFSSPIRLHLCASLFLLLPHLFPAPISIGGCLSLWKGSIGTLVAYPVGAVASWNVLVSVSHKGGNREEKGAMRVTSPSHGSVDGTTCKVLLTMWVAATAGRSPRRAALSHRGSAALHYAHLAMRRSSDGPRALPRRPGSSLPGRWSLS
jgi:hypothetical protein